MAAPSAGVMLVLLLAPLVVLVVLGTLIAFVAGGRGRPGLHRQSAEQPLRADEYVGHGWRERHENGRSITVSDEVAPTVRAVNATVRSPDGEPRF